MIKRESEHAEKRRGKPGSDKILSIRLRASMESSEDDDRRFYSTTLQRASTVRAVRCMTRLHARSAMTRHET